MAFIADRSRRARQTDGRAHNFALQLSARTVLAVGLSVLRTNSEPLAAFSDVENSGHLFGDRSDR